MCNSWRGFVDLVYSDQAICPFGSRNRPHWCTVSSAACPRYWEIAWASGACIFNRCLSHLGKSTKPLPRSSEAHGLESSFVKLRVGTRGLSALTWQCRIPCCARLENGSDGWWISCPRLPIVRSIVHWEEKMGDPTCMASAARWLHKWMHGWTKWMQSICRW